MATWLILVLMMFEGVAGPDYEDIDYSQLSKARQIYQQVLSQNAVQKAVQEEKKKDSFEVNWQQVTGSAAQVHYLVTGPSCAPCITRKNFLRSQGIAFTEITIQEAASFGHTVTRIPYEFDYSSLIKTQSADVDYPPSSHVFIAALTEHLLAQSNKEATYASLFEIDVDVPDAVPGMINTLMSGQRWSNGVLTIDWAGKRTISIEKDKIIFNPPPTVTARKSILSYSTSLKQIMIKEGGKRIETELTTCPNLTVNFK